MKKSYTGFPITKPEPGFEGEPTLWIPMLRVRCMYQHQLMPPILAVVDSGSPYCIFRTEIADFLHIDLTNVPKSSMGGVISGVQDVTYFHKITLQVVNNWTFDVMGAFMKKLSVPAILGRKGFFDRFIVTFDQSKTPHEFEVAKIERPN
ncbi:MAG: hypothetical protein ABR501_10250 [Pyrinomonadaceae bacterium]